MENKNKIKGIRNPQQVIDLLDFMDKKISGEKKSLFDDDETKELLRLFKKIEFDRNNW